MAIKKKERTGNNFNCVEFVQYIKDGLKAYAPNVVASIKAFAAEKMQTTAERYAGVVIDAALDADLAHDGTLTTALVKARKWRSEEIKVELLDKVALYRYYATGDYRLNEKSVTTPALVMRAVRAMHEGKSHEAYVLFDKALKQHNKHTTHKNILPDAISSFFLMLNYAIIGDDTCKKKMLQFSNKNNLRQYYDYTPAFAIADAATRLDGFSEETTYRRLLYNGRLLANRLCRTFGEALSVAHSREHLLADRKLHIPAMAILRHEFQLFFDIPDNVKAHDNELFGPAPLFFNTKPLAEWELSLNAIRSTWEQEKEKEVQANSGLLKERLAYCIINNYHVEIRLQKRLKSGVWGVPGREIPLSNITSGQQELFCDADRKVKDCIDDYWTLPPRDVLPHLVGCDNVYLHNRDEGTYESVTVAEERAYFIFDRTEQGFTFTSNLDTTNNDVRYEETCALFMKSPTSYLVVRYTPEELKYYQMFCKVRLLPPEAETLLKDILPKVCEKITVQSPIVETGEAALETLKGETHIVVRVAPMNNGFYLMDILAKAHPDATTLYTPGRGSASVYDDVDGKRYRIKRHLRKEEELANELTDAMSDIEEDEASYDDCFLDTQNDFEYNVTPQGLLELMDNLQENPENYHLEWREGAKLSLRRAPEAKKWNIQLKQKAGWFDVEGEVTLDEGRTISIATLLAALTQSGKSRFVRLGEGEFLALSQKLKKQLARLESIAMADRDGLHISAANAALLGEALQGEVRIEGAENVQLLTERIHEAYTLRPNTPRQLQATLRDYQLDGFRWMTRLNGWGAGACLADDMGLGKTVQTIAFLLHKAQAGASLVVAPTSVVPNWQAELERFAPTLCVKMLNSCTIEERATMIKEAKKGDVVVTTYGLLNIEQEALTGRTWNVACLDEAHTIKNRDTKMARVAYALRADARLALTGTPLQNHLDELWSLFHFINPGLLGSFEAFSHKFVVQDAESDYAEERRRQLKRIITPFILRRTKTEVVDELPEKTEIVRHVELSPDELHVYEVLRKTAEERLNEEGKVSVSVLAEITKLRQAACAASLAEPKATFESTKINELLSLLEELEESGSRVLVFSQFTSFLRMVREALEASKRNYLYLDGSTPLKQRQELVRRFQEGESSVFVISLKAGGLGLNLTGANCVVHLDPWWNPAIEQQATDRAYRIGQKQKVMVYHLISANTIEEKILRLHQSKRDLADALLSGTDMSHRLTEKELREMLA